VFELAWPIRASDQQKSGALHDKADDMLSPDCTLCEASQICYDWYYTSAGLTVPNFEWAGS
jgi:hypothetical protein